MSELQEKTIGRSDLLVSHFLNLLGIGILLWGTSVRAEGICQHRDQNNQFDLFNLSKTISENFNDDMAAIYQEALRCPDRVWNSPHIKLGTIPTYFYRASESTMCKLENKDSVCLDSNDVLEKDSAKRYLADFVGYAIYFDQKNSREYLVLNRSWKDFRDRAESANRDFLNKVNSRTRKCGRFASEGTLRPKQLDIQLNNRSDVAGFCIHEHFHLFQRSWPRVIGNSENLKKEMHTEGYREKIELLRERLTYHLQTYIELRLGGRNKEAETHLVFTKGYYDEMKASFPESFSQLNDKFEGVAFYVEARSHGLHSLGCDAKEEEIKRSMAAFLSDGVSKQAGFRDSPYVLNSLASLALDVNGNNNWKNSVETSQQTPLDILLKQVPTPTLKQLQRDRVAGHALAKCMAK